MRVAGMTLFFSKQTVGQALARRGMLMLADAFPLPVKASGGMRHCSLKEKTASKFIQSRSTRMKEDRIASADVREQQIEDI